MLYKCMSRDRNVTQKQLEGGAGILSISVDPVCIFREITGIRIIWRGFFPPLHRNVSNSDIATV